MKSLSQRLPRIPAAKSARARWTDFCLVRLKKKIPKTIIKAAIDTVARAHRCPDAIPKAAPEFSAIIKVRKPSMTEKLWSGRLGSHWNTAFLLHKSSVVPSTMTSQKTRWAFRLGSVVDEHRDKKPRPMRRALVFSFSASVITLLWASSKKRQFAGYEFDFALLFLL